MPRSARCRMPSQALHQCLFTGRPVIMRSSLPVPVALNACFFDSPRWSLAGGPGNQALALYQKIPASLPPQVRFQKLVIPVPLCSPGAMHCGARLMPSSSATLIYDALLSSGHGMPVKAAEIS